MKKLTRIIILSLIGGLLVFAMITNTTRKTPRSETVWNEGMTLGSMDAKNYFIVYTDLMCPYCNLYAQEVYRNEDEFEKYLADNDILYEVRVTDMLYESNGIEYSKTSAEAAYCADRDGKFWDFYHAALTAIENDYYSRGIGNSKTAPKISDMTEEYWLNIGREVGLSDSFETCLKNGESLEEVSEKTGKASDNAVGLPSYKFNSYETSGFDPTWDFELIKQMYDAGLKS